MVTAMVCYSGKTRRKDQEKQILELAEKYHGNLIAVTHEKFEVRMNFDFAYPTSAITFVGKGCTDQLFIVPD